MKDFDLCAFENKSPLSLIRPILLRELGLRQGAPSGGAIIQGNFSLRNLLSRGPIREEYLKRSKSSCACETFFLKVRVQNLQLSCLSRFIWKANGVSALSSKIWKSWDPIGQAITDRDNKFRIECT